MSANFVQPISDPQPKRRSRRRLLFVVVGLLVVFVASALFGIGRFASAALSARDHMEATVESITELSFTSAKENVDLAIEDAYTARSGLRWIGWVGALPWVGDHYEGVVVILDSAIASGEAFSEVLTIAIEVEEVLVEAQSILDLTDLEESYTFETFPEELKRELLLTLHQQSDAFYETALKLRLAQQELDSLNNLELAPGFAEQIAPMQELLPELADSFELLAPIAQSLDAFAGLESDKQWLLLFLNNTEMRAGGGFMGVYGLLQVSEGSIEQLLVDDTYSIDRLVEGDEYQVAAPQPIHDYLHVDKWYFRDANWSPDFAESSELATTLLRQEYSHIGQPVPQIDGVIGFTTTVSERLLELIGPVTVEGITFTSENVTEVLEYEVEFGYVDKGIPFDQRKVLVGLLMDAVLDELFSIPVDDWPSLFAMLQMSFLDKQMAVYSSDEQTQEIFEDAGWAATVDVERADDVLLVVDSNMAALKTDHAMERHVSYSIEPDGDDLVAEVSILYDHQGVFDWRTTRYLTYTRVYAPLGSEILSIEGSTMAEADVQEELGMVSFGAHFTVEPGEQGTLTYRYRLPASVSEAVDTGVYQLAVIKQIGAKNHALTLDLDFGTTLRSATPSEQEEHFGDSAYQLNTEISHDAIVTIEF